MCGPEGGTQGPNPTPKAFSNARTLNPLEGRGRCLTRTTCSGAPLPWTADGTTVNAGGFAPPSNVSFTRQSGERKCNHTARFRLESPAVCPGGTKIFACDACRDHPQGGSVEEIPRQRQ